MNTTDVLKALHRHDFMNKPMLAYMAKYPEEAFNYASKVLEGPFPAGEAVIAKDYCCACNYAINVLKGPFPAGEAAIAKNPKWAYWYANYVLKPKGIKSFPAGEPAIANSEWAYEYARDVLEGPFPLGEVAIATDPDWAYIYSKSILKDPNPKTWAERYKNGNN